MARGPQTDDVIPPAPPSQMDLEAERERKAELNRQRQARYRENHKAEQAESGAPEHDALPLASGASREIRNAEIQVRNVPTAQPTQPVKLLTIQEAEDSRDKLIFLFTHGSSILDDILEIIVKGHEEVKIWELDEDEAGMLADIQLEKARKDKDAARVVRVMLRIYERITLMLLVVPRSKATMSHIRKHKGLSFR